MASDSRTFPVFKLFLKKVLKKKNFIYKVRSLKEKEFFRKCRKKNFRKITRPSKKKKKDERENRGGKSLHLRSVGGMGKLFNRQIPEIHFLCGKGEKKLTNLTLI